MYVIYLGSPVPAKWHNCDDWKYDLNHYGLDQQLTYLLYSLVFILPSSGEKKLLPMFAALLPLMLVLLTVEQMDFKERKAKETILHKNRY